MPKMPDDDRVLSSNLSFSPRYTNRGMIFRRYTDGNNVMTAKITSSHDPRPATLAYRDPQTENDPGSAVAPRETEPEPHTLVDAIRAFGVVVGPSVAFHAITFGSIPALLFGQRHRPRAALGVAALAAYWLAIRPWHLRWGASNCEIVQRLPGDEVEPDPAIEATRSVTIDAPVEEVWPWLAQIGQDRGGFYSYEWLENLAGCRMHNANRIHPEWQQRHVGETIMLHPATGLKVSRFEPDHVFTIERWGTYVLQPTSDGHRTRLIGRSRVGRGPAALFYVLCIEIPHAVMERKMLLGIKERVERSHMLAT